MHPMYQLPQEKGPELYQEDIIDREALISQINGNAADSSKRLTRCRSRSNEDLIEFTRDGAVI